MAIASVATILLPALAAVILYGAFKLIHHRLQWRNVPQPPGNFLMGHLKLMGETMTLFPPNIPPMYVFTEWHRRYNLPDIFYVDLWPLGPVFMVLATKEAAVHAVQTRGYGKAAKLISDALTPIMGPDPIVAVNGAPWKAAHRMIAPAFKPSAVRGMLANVAKEVGLFNKQLARLAEKREVFRFEDLVTKLVFCIVTQSIIGVRFSALTDEKPDPIMQDIFSPAKDSPAAEASWNPWEKFVLSRKAAAALARSGKWLRQLILERYRTQRRDPGRAAESLLDAILVDRIEQEEQGVVQSLERDPEHLDMLVNQMRVLVFGASGTTIDTLCFVFMLLAVHPKVLKELRAEHDRFGGEDMSGALNAVENQPHRVAELEYTADVLKETLRMYPVGFTVRMDDKDNGLMTYNGQTYPTKNVSVAPCNFTMQYAASNFTDPQSFRPERWLGDEGKTIDRNAWRPFELGPRACMGRELVMDEMRTILLLCVRWFDFELADDGTGIAIPHKEPAVDWARMDLLVGDLAFQELGMEAKPRHGMPMKVRRTERPL